MSDAVLHAAVERAVGEPVARLERRRCAHESSFALDRLDVITASGRVERLVLKDLNTLNEQGSAAKRRARVDPRRELAAYRDVLAGAGLDTPALRGWVADEEHDRWWLLLEHVEGIPLWQAGTSAWRATARWLARLRDVPAASPHLLRYDAQALLPWLDRARPLVPAGALDGVGAVWSDAVEQVAASPWAFVHGDLYPANVLVDGTRIRTVDWEMAGRGPAVLDLAALTSGTWNEQDRAAVVAAADAPAAVLDALEAARLVVAVQWLGWSSVWSPPAEHAHDWLADAVAYADRLAA